MGTKGIVGQAEQASPQAADKRVGSQGTDGGESAERTGTSRAHTAGPWTVVADGPWVVGPHGETVALTQSITAMPGEEHANAHLISAAPELLEMAQVVAEGVNAYFDNREHGWTKATADDYLRQLQSLACDVIRKAEGGRQ